MVLFTLLSFAILIALIVGQFKIASRALHERKAGIGRFTYSFDDAPVAFALVLLLEWIGLIVVLVYLLSLVALAVFQ